MKSIKENHHFINNLTIHLHMRAFIKFKKQIHGSQLIHLIPEVLELFKKKLIFNKKFNFLN